MSTNQNNLSSTEKIKIASDGLRGTLKESLRDEITGAIREDDTALVKFHGMYQQDDRDRRERLNTPSAACGRSALHALL